MNRRLYSAVAAGLILGAALPLHAQIAILPDVLGATIGNMAAAGAAERECLSGDAPSADKIASTRAGAETVMRDYLRLAGASETADVSTAFTARVKRREWLSGGEPGLVTAVRDPIARSLAAEGAALPDPAAFYRARDGRTALGLWVIPSTAPDGGPAPLGHYRVQFRSETGGWKIARLELVQGGADPAPATQYCHKPGDVEEYRTAMAELKAKREQRKAEKAARRAERERAEAAN